MAWQYKAYSKYSEEDEIEKRISQSEDQQPSFIVEGEALKRVQKINIFEPCANQIGDRYMYTLRENDCIYLKEQWKRLEKDVIRSENEELLPQAKHPSVAKKNQSSGLAKKGNQVRRKKRDGHFREDGKTTSNDIDSGIGKL